MTRQEYINKVKVKLDEVSPFDEPLTFIAADGDSSYDKVKPIVNYIDELLDNATQFCLRVLPLSLLSADVEKKEEELTVSNKIGEIKGYADRRLCRVRVADWKRDVTHFFTSEDANYLIQQNEHTRSGIAKPSVFYVAEEDHLELYSFSYETTTNSALVWSIDTLKRTEDVESNISDFIALKCAQLVLDVLGSTNSAIMEKEFERKVNAV
jgi:hypothetical protein